MRKSNIGSSQRPGVLRPRNSDSTPNNRRSGGQAARKSYIPKMGGTVERPTRRGSGDASSRPSAASMRFTPRGSASSRPAAASLRFTPTRNHPYPASTNVLAVPSSATRQSPSARSSSMGTVSRKEMRPITDSAFKSRCIDRIIDFLITNGYDSPVERRTLLTPTAKDFANIFQFIYRHLDGTYQLHGKFEDEIPRILKAIKYPVQIPKSSFITVGSPHTWPSLLAMLDWLIEVIDFGNSVDVEAIMFPVDFESGRQLQRIRFEAEVKLFRCQTEQEVEECHEEYRHKMEYQHGVRPQDMMKTQEEMERLEDEVRAFSVEEGRADELKKLHLQILNDIEKLQAYCVELENFIANKDVEMAAQKKKLEQEHQKIQKQCEEISRLTNLKKEQALSPVELAHFKNHAQEVAGVSEQLQLQFEDLDSKIWSMEMETAKTVKSLNESIGTYNGLVTQLGLPTEFEAPLAINSDNLHHLQHHVLGLLRSKKKEVKRDAFQAQATVSQKEEELYMAKEMLQEMSVEAARLESKLKRVEEDAFIAKKDVETEQREMTEESERLLEQIQEERKANKCSLYQKQCAVDQAKEELERTLALSRERSHKGVEFLLKVMAVARKHIQIDSQECLKYKMTCEKMTKQFEEVVKDARKELTLTAASIAKAETEERQ